MNILTIHECYLEVIDKLWLSINVSSFEVNDSESNPTEKSAICIQKFYLNLFLRFPLFKQTFWKFAVHSIVIPSRHSGIFYSYVKLIPLQPGCFLLCSSHERALIFIKNLQKTLVLMSSCSFYHDIFFVVIRTSLLVQGYPKYGTYYPEQQRIKEYLYSKTANSASPSLQHIRNLTTFQDHASEYQGQWHQKYQRVNKIQ